MNRKQLIAMWLGIIAFVVMGLFPPWIIILPPDSKELATGSRCEFEYGFLISHTLEFDKADQGSYTNSTDAAIRLNIMHQIDFPTLIIQWLIVGTITTGFILSFRNKKQ